MIERVATINYEINIGYDGEVESRVILFPIAELRDKFPTATFSLVHQRNGDDNPYICVTETDEKYLRWTIKPTDVNKIGIGEAQLILNEGNKILKSIIYKTKTSKSLGDTIEVPPPYQPWVDSVLKEFAFSHKLENITCNYISIPHSAEPHCDSEETEDGLILTFYIPQGEKGADGKDGKDGKDGEKGEKGDDYILTEADKSEIASQIHYDDSELREMIDSKASIIMLHSELSNGVWSIKNADGNTLTYADIKALHNKEDYIVCLHQNVIHSTSFLTDAIEFMGTYYINDNGHISRLIINDANVVKADGYTLENAENRLDDLEGYEAGDIPNSYPSADALVEYIKNGNNLPKADSNGHYGAISLGQGIYNTSQGKTSVNYAGNDQVDGRKSGFAVSSSNLDYAVKQALTDGKGTAYTSDEKKSARERFGIVTLTQAEYDALTPSADTIYMIVEE